MADPDEIRVIGVTKGSRSGPMKLEGKRHPQNKFFF